MNGCGGQRERDGEARLKVCRGSGARVLWAVSAMQGEGEGGRWQSFPLPNQQAERRSVSFLHRCRRRLQPTVPMAGPVRAGLPPI